IDADESNYGLHRHLGMKNPKDFTGFFGGKENVLNDMMLSNFSRQFFSESWQLEDIPEGYYTEKNGIKLVVSGKIHQANEGCACAMGTIIKQFVANLTLSEEQIAILDMDAGIEHFGRGLDNEVDVILVICDPSYESLQLAKKIKELADNIQKPVYYILNKVQDGSEEILENAIVDKSLILAVYPMKNQLLQAALRGEELKADTLDTSIVAKKILQG
ncbi:MAG: ATP-binding protein, partial [Bacillota bacterium]|nr:ATP-binding protein [Bacillota bacterium]